MVSEITRPEPLAQALDEAVGVGQDHAARGQGDEGYADRDERRERDRRNHRSTTTTTVSANIRNRAASEQALVRARATELAEVRRNQVRLRAGYGDATTRDVMTGEAGRAALRHAMLDRLVSALQDGPPPAAGR